MRLLCLALLFTACEPTQPTKNDTQPGPVDTQDDPVDTQDPDVGPQDNDGDGFYDDCDDDNAAIYPGAAEVCDGLDNDCNGLVDDDPVDDVQYFEDADSDGFGNAAEAEWACESPTGFVTNDLDCDDTSALFNPSAIEAAGNSSSFLFSLTDNYQVQHCTGQHGCGTPQYNVNHYGPTFGGGHDWHVAGGMNGGYCNLGHDYACQVGSYGSSTCRNDFCGNYESWTINDIEVWGL